MVISHRIAVGIIPSVRSSRDRGCSRKSGTIALTGKMIVPMQTKTILDLNLLKSKVKLAFFDFNSVP
ncbi:hypothetical protein [Microcoleus sp. F4-D5]|uniref:hypothetical protein n=1 Tax=Microcoleus sp. F4-D5 TaxID=2818760 RepID=UPI002FD58C93